MGVGVLGAPDPAPEAVTNYHVTPPPPPPPLEDSPCQNPAMQPLKLIAMEFQERDFSSFWPMMVVLVS